MKKTVLLFFFVLLQLIAFGQATERLKYMAKNTTTIVGSSEAPKPARNPSLLREAPSDNSVAVKDSVSAPFKRSFQVGSIIHMFGSLTQSKTTAVQDADPNFDNKWNRGFTLYRARILFGAPISRKGSIFFETDIPSAIGSGANGTKNIKVSPIILDAQYEYDFSNHFTLIAGQQLVSHNRNGLQGAAALMSNDFTYYQYPYNLFESSPLQGNFGRDLGVNARGFFLKDKLEYRLGTFTGRKFGGEGPLRVVGRVVYNFLDPEKDYYYAGTKLGAGKTFALAGGFDMQGSYQNFGVDAFVDIPLSRLGSLTVNTAFTTMTGGTGSGKYSFSQMIPRQTVEFLELGYYFKAIKLQPWVKFENQSINTQASQFGLPENATSEQIKAINKLNSNTRVGGGVNYFFDSYNANLKASYTQAFYGRADINNNPEVKSFGEFWLQLQIFIF